MGAKQKKSSNKKAQTMPADKTQAADFLVYLLICKFLVIFSLRICFFLTNWSLLKSLEGGPARKLPVEKSPVTGKSTVLYIGRIPHGFYEAEMKGLFYYNSLFVYIMDIICFPVLI